MENCIICNKISNAEFNRKRYCSEHFKSVLTKYCSNIHYEPSDEDAFHVAFNKQLKRAKKSRKINTPSGTAKFFDQ